MSHPRYRRGSDQMNGIHDLGGMHGFGPVKAEANEPVFHAAWEGRVFALANLYLGLGFGNIDRFRHAIERLPPATYLTAGYYGRWLGALETLLAEDGVVGRAEIDSGEQGRPLAGAATATPAPPGNASGAAKRSLDAAPRFTSGQIVRARNINPSGHTRLPRYVRGKRGLVAHVHPAWVFPDTNAHGLGESPQYVYAVRFEAAELWGPQAEAATAMHVDLFESYLEPVSGNE
jgi:nitrile hydratase beta subunit